MTFKELLIRHFASPGFQRRARNIYWPFIKTAVSYVYNQLNHKWNESYYLDQMKYSEDRPVGEEADGATYTVTGKPLTQEAAFDLVRKYLVDHESQNFGMCVTHSVKNIYRFAAKVVFGGRTDFSEHDIYLDRTTRQSGIDQGMNPSATLDRIIIKGVAIDGTVPDPQRELDLNTTRGDYPDDLLAPWRVKLIKSRGLIDAREDFEKVWAFVTETYAKRGVRPFQASIISLTGWWKSDVPTATGTNRGGHSIMGLTIPFIYQGKRAFFVFDSSYRSGLVWKIAPGVRIVTEDCWNGLGRYIRPVEFVDVIEQKLGGAAAPVGEPTIPKLTMTAQFGQDNEYVAAIQRALRHFGYVIPALDAGQKPGFYGTETAAAVMKWQVDFAPVFNQIDAQWNAASLAALQGQSFGNVSIQVMNMLIDQQNA